MCACVCVGVWFCGHVVRRCVHLCWLYWLVCGLLSASVCVCLLVCVFLLAAVVVCVLSLLWFVLVGVE